MLSAGRIFFPTPRFVKIFEAAGKSTFPNGFTYSIQRSRIVEEVLFQFLGCPHPRTRIYFGRQKRSIPEHFSFPFLAMGADKNSTALPVKNLRELEESALRSNPLLVQEEMECEDRFRIIFVNFEFVGMGSAAPWMVRPKSGADMFSSRSAAELIRDVARIVRSVGLNDIAVEVGVGKNGWFIIGFVRPPVFCSTPGGVVNRHKFISNLIEKGSFFM